MTQATAAPGSARYKKLAKIAAVAGLGVGGAVLLGMAARGHITPEGGITGRPSRPSGPRGPGGLGGGPRSTPSVPVNPAAKALPSGSSKIRNKELKALEDYVNDSAGLNSALYRGGADGVDAEALQMIKGIDSYLSRAPKVKGSYMRGVPSDRAAMKLMDMKVGDVFTDTGYGSFSTDFRKAKSFARTPMARRPHGDGPYRRVIVRVRGELTPVPYGKLGEYANKRARRKSPSGTTRDSGVEFFKTEKEFLAPRGSSYRILNSRIVDTAKGVNTYLLLDVEQLPTQVTHIPLQGKGRPKIPKKREYGIITWH